MVELILLVRPASAATVHVSYLVEAADFLEADPRKDRPLLFELYSTGTCVDPALKQEFVTVQAVPAPAGHPPRRAKKALKPPPALKVETDLAWDAPRPVFYLRVTGPGVKPLGGVCQLQVTEVAGCEVHRPPSCPPDSVVSNDLCVDRYEASLWEIPASRVELIRKVVAGTVTLSDLAGGGARQVGFPDAPFGHAPVMGSFLAEGAYTTRLYAASLPGVLPSTFVSAYQAWAACGFSGKRLLTSGEWTAAAKGTPTPSTDDGATDCNIGARMLSSGAPVKTGSRSGCVSSAGTFDMVGNVSEWTMDGYTTTRHRGGAWDAGDAAGISFTQLDVPLIQDNAIGFRCGR